MSELCYVLCVGLIRVAQLDSPFYCFVQLLQFFFPQNVLFFLVGEKKCCTPEGGEGGGRGGGLIMADVMYLFQRYGDQII